MIGTVFIVPECRRRKALGLHFQFKIPTNGVWIARRDTFACTYICLNHDSGSNACEKCEFRRIPAVLLLLPDGSDLNQCLPHLASIAEVYFQTAFKKNQLQQASHEQPQQPHHLYI